MDLPRDKLAQWAQTLGLDLVGVADIAVYRDVAARWNPLSILPEARSIVVFGKVIPRSYFRGIEEGTVWMRVNRHLPPKYAYYLCRMFEDNGFPTVPCSPLAPERWPDGVAVDAGKPAPNVTPDLYEAAQLAGLGEIAYNGAFLTPVFGVRQALGMLFTAALIQPDPPFESGRLCDRSQCGQCVTACPAQALSAEPSTRTVGSRTIVIGRYNNAKCRFCVNGAFPDTSCAAASPNRMTAACTRACLARLEDGGSIATHYRSAFRRRAPWGFDVFEA